MRVVLLSLLLCACAAEGVDPIADPVDEVDPPDAPAEHVCDATARIQFEQGSPWSPIEKDACFSGCEDGDRQGFSQGRLACISDDDPCPDCIATQPDPAYDTGFSHCFAESYMSGYASEGCDP